MDQIFLMVPALQQHYYSNLVGSEILSQTGTGTVSNKNVGSGKA